MTIVFPANLPCPTPGSFSEGEVDTNVSDDNDMGLSSTRATTTKAFRTFGWSAIMTEAQRQEILEFYDTTLGRVKPFAWVHPWSGEQMQVRLGSRPTADHFSVGYWTISINMVEI